MGNQEYMLLNVSLLIFATVVTSSIINPQIKCDLAGLNRGSFDEDFVFGAASSAYQYEGAGNEGGRGLSIWDTYTHYPGNIKDGSDGSVAVDFYHRYKEDVEIMREMGLDAYRFSISWSRILPSGKLSGGVNHEGIRYYNHLIDELIAKGLKPFATILHFDLPQALENDYGGFLSSQIVKDFRDYAEVCFREFGDRVKHWITINEPWTYSYGGYGEGFLAPGRCSWPERSCSGGDSGREPYIVAHHQLLAHAAVVQLYRQNYQAFQEGKIGITLVSNWFEPMSYTNEGDLEAQQRALDFMLGWFMEPLTSGNYPKVMLKNVGSSRLPQFNEEEIEMVKNSFDFLGLNYYTADYVTNGPHPITENPSYWTDMEVQVKYEDEKGIPIGQKAALDWLHIYPSGIQKLLEHINRKYRVSEIYITENGVDGPNNSTDTVSEALADVMRIEYHQDHLCFLKQAIESIRDENKDKRKELEVKGYFVWSLLDNFEWGNGYTIRFGMIYVDYNNNLTRYPKDSAIWFHDFLSRREQVINEY